MQLIFRKVSDVLKEQELAERRKNDPVLNHTQDHLVRKLFNKFKKGPDGGPSGGTVGPDKTGPLIPPNINNARDIEKGETLSTSQGTKSEVTPVDGAAEPSPAAPPKPKPKPVGLKGWGRLRGDKPAPPPAAAMPPKIETVKPAPSAVAPDTTEINKKGDTVVDSGKSDATANGKLPSAVAVSGSNNQQQMNGPQYEALNDRLNRIEKLITDLMIKVDDKTRSIEKTVAKVKSSKSKHFKPPQAVTICVDSPSGGGMSPGTCDEQFL